MLAHGRARKRAVHSSVSKYDAIEPTPAELPERLRDVERLIEEGALGQARIELEQCRETEPPPLVELVGLQLGVAAHELDPSSALAAVVAFLRSEPRNALALRLYRELSMLQYRAGQSCLSHSHPPPSARSR